MINAHNIIKSEYIINHENFKLDNHLVRHCSAYTSSFDPPLLRRASLHSPLLKTTSISSSWLPGQECHLSLASFLTKTNAENSSMVDRGPESEYIRQQKESSV